MTNIARYWPDVSPAAFTILREVAQEVQRQVDGELAHRRFSDHIPRSELITLAADIVRCIEARDAKV